MATASFHYEALRFLLNLARRGHTSHSRILLAPTGIVRVHFIEITFCAVIFLPASGPLALGNFGGDTASGLVTPPHFPAETYSTLGYGDIVPRRDMRMLAGAEALNGLLLLAW